MTDKMTVTKADILKPLEVLLADLTVLQEQADILAAQVTELSERVNRYVEYIEGLEWQG